MKLKKVTELSYVELKKETLARGLTVATPSVMQNAVQKHRDENPDFQLPIVVLAPKAHKEESPIAIIEHQMKTPEKKVAKKVAKKKAAKKVNVKKVIAEHRAKGKEQKATKKVAKVSNAGKKKDEILKLKKEGLSVQEIVTKTGYNYSTVYECINTHTIKTYFDKGLSAKEISDKMGKKEKNIVAFIKRNKLGK